MVGNAILMVTSRKQCFIFSSETIRLMVDIVIQVIISLQL